MWHKLIEGVCFCGWRFLVILAGNTFLRFSASPRLRIDIDFVFIEYVQWKYMFFNNHNVLTLCSTSISLYAILFLNKRDKIVIDQT